MLEWEHTEDCYLMQWQKPSPLLSEFTALCGMILTAKQSIFLRIQVRASSQTKGLERG